MVPVAASTLTIHDGEIASAIRWCVEHQRYPGRRLLLHDVLRSAFARTKAFIATHSPMRCCYSVKINPSSAALELAKQCGMAAEVISPGEYAQATSCGFSGEDIVYNGPVPAWTCPTPPGYVFADSLEAFVRVCREFAEALVGLRVRPSGISSHFGIPPAEVDAAAAAISASGRRQFGVSFHVRNEDYGSRGFRDLVADALEFARQIEQRTGDVATLFDVGGGHSPQQFDALAAAGDFEWLCDAVPRELPAVSAIFCELGQEIVTAGEAVLAPVLEVRRSRERPEIVVDAGYPDLPQVYAFRHRLFAVDGTSVERLQPGNGRIIGRTCLEYDVIAEGVDLAPCREGAAVAIADAGAYDAGMAFCFGQGSRSSDLR